MFCRQCGEENEKEAIFCIKCGASLKGDSEIEDSGGKIPKSLFMRILPVCLLSVVLVAGIGATLLAVGAGRNSEEADTKEEITDSEITEEYEQDSSLETTEQKAAEIEQWRTLYADYIKDNLDIFADIEGRTNPSVPYGFFDVDGDGMPEMFTFVGMGTAAWSNHIFTIRDGKVQTYDSTMENGISDSLGGEMYITTDHRILVAMFDAMHYPSRGSLTEYRIENGRIEERLIVAYMYTDEGNYTYSVESVQGDNSKEITKKEFQQVLQEYGCSFQDNMIHISGNNLIPFYDIMTLSFEGYSSANLEQIDRDIAAYTLLTNANTREVQEEDNSKTEELEESGDSASDGSDSYIEDEYAGYKMLVPAGFQLDEVVDGKYIFKNERADTVLTWSGCKKESGKQESDGVKYYSDGEKCLQHAKKMIDYDLSYSTAKDNYCCYSYTDDEGIIYYCAFHMDKKLTYGFQLQYSQNDKEYYDPMIEKLANYIIKDEGRNE